MSMHFVSPATSSLPELQAQTVPRVLQLTVSVPRTEAECDALLARAARLMRVAPSVDVVADLTRFLGAASRVWTPPRRQQLRDILAGAGAASVAPVLSEVARHPRAEILDEAELLLRDLIRREPSLGPILAREAKANPNAHVRSVLLTALATSSEPYVHEALVAGLDDPSPRAREAAVWALVNRGGRGARHALEQRIARETDPRTREAIEDALAELAG